MAVEPFDEERDWAADKRDFVADRRDDVAAERDALADAREAAADERERLADRRESALDERERLADRRESALDEREQRVDVPAAHLERLSAVTGPERREEVDLGADARSARRQAAREREQDKVKRDAAAEQRAEAAERRQAARPNTRLAMVFADIAQILYAADNFEDVLRRIAEAAVSTVPGCRMASVTLSEDGAFRTVASTDEAATATDEAQYQVNQGPCLDAIEEPVVYAPSFPDNRWPALASRPIDFGVHAATSYCLARSGVADRGSFAGSLNAYAVRADAFDEEAREIGLILAVHASAASLAVHERVALEQLGRHLQQGLTSRDVIGQAKGILMERLKITPEAAFDMLRRSSQQLNEKLRDIAQRLADTGVYDQADTNLRAPTNLPRRSVRDGQTRPRPT